MDITIEQKEAVEEIAGRNIGLWSVCARITVKANDHQDFIEAFRSQYADSKATMRGIFEEKLIQKLLPQ